VAIAVTVGLQIPEYRSIQAIAIFWILGGLLSLLIGCKPLLQSDWSNTWEIRPKLDWIRKGLSVAMPFFISMAALNTIYFSDRFIIQHFSGIEQVGLYTFHQSVAGLVYTAIGVGVLGIIYPKVVKAFLIRDIPQYTQERQTLALAIISGSILVSLFLILIFPYAANFMKNPQFIETRSVFFILLLGSVIQNISFIPHYDLYARSIDRDLMWSTILAAALNVVLNVLWIPKFGIIGAAWATTAAYIMLLITKSWAVAIRSKQPGWIPPQNSNTLETNNE